jgi:type IX secretion system PorP/SprF family membrane protein
MRKIILTAILICVYIVINAQQDAHYSQFFSNKLIQNPAYAGSAEVLSMTSLHRQQWVGLKGAPSTQTISMHAPIFKKKVGVGLSIMRDDITISENWKISTSYAYRIRLETGTLSIGLQADLRFMKIKWNEVQALELNDNEIPDLNTQKFQPELASGIYYNTKRFYAGFAIQNMIQSRWKRDANTLLGYLPANQQHYYLMSGYVLPISKNVDFSPVVLMKLVKNAPMNLDINASFIFYDKLWTGVSWRKDDSIDVILQYQLNLQMRLGVAYDFTISELQQVNSGTYEVMLNYNFEYDNSGYRNLRYF